jgi:chemotaxis response regulator CheB
VGEAENGEQAVRSMSEFNPDVVLIDIIGPADNFIPKSGLITDLVPAIRRSPGIDPPMT